MSERVPDPDERIESYLGELLLALRGHPQAARRPLTEAESHLRESVAAGAAAGSPAAAGERGPQLMLADPARAETARLAVAEAQQIAAAAGPMAPGDTSTPTASAPCAADVPRWLPARRVHLVPVVRDR